MKAFWLFLLELLADAFYPPAAEGQPRKLKASAGGVALLLVVLLGGLTYYELRAVRAEQADQKVMLAEVKTGVTSLWTWALTGKIQRDARASQTDVDEEAAQRVADSLPPVPLRCAGCAAAAEAPVPPIGVRVPAAGVAAGAVDVGDRGQLNGGR